MIYSLWEPIAPRITAVAPLMAASLTYGPVVAANFHKGMDDTIFTSDLDLNPKKCDAYRKSYIY
jgi:hypothetical protein